MVARAGFRPADDVAVGVLAGVYEDAAGRGRRVLLAVAERARAVGRRAYEIAAHLVVRGVAADEDACERVARDEVARGGRRAAHGVVRRVVDEDAGGVAGGLGPAGVRADEVAFDEVAAVVRLRAQAREVEVV